jgi:hypothetical protein
MGAIKGSQKIIAMGLAGTFGTPVALATGKRLEVESFSASENTEELTSNSIGSGLLMQTNSERGSISPTVDIEMHAGYEDAGVEAVAQFFGDCSVSSVVAGAHAHLFKVNEDFNEEFLTVAEQLTDTKSAEYPSCVATSLNFSIVPNDYVGLSINLLANLQNLDSAVNNVAQLDLTTVASSVRVVARPGDTFRINAIGGGALAAGDVVDITDAQIELSKPQEQVHEIRGEDGNGIPDSSEGMPLEATITITRKNQPDIDFMEAHQDGDEFKADVKITGPIITGSTPYAYELYFPRLRVVDPVDNAASSAGRNSETIVFKALAVVGALPTGMLNKYPYARIVNAKATKYAA